MGPQLAGETGGGKQRDTAIRPCPFCFWAPETAARLVWSPLRKVLASLTETTTDARPGLLDWWRSGSAVARRALIAAALGWMLDAFDVMLYALVLASLIEDLGLSHVTAGWLGSITLAASALGGALFGVMADRLGRVRALTVSVLIYSIFTALCGLATSVWQLALFRAALGLGMGGEWACGAALVSETWPAKHRGKALALVQSAWAIGFALAALVTAVVLPR